MNKGIGDEVFNYIVHCLNFHFDLYFMNYVICIGMVLYMHTAIKSMNVQIHHSQMYRS